MEPNQVSKQRMYKISLVLLIICTVIAVAVGTVFLLKKLEPAPITPIVTGKTADEVTTAYAKPQAIAMLSPDTYAQSSNLVTAASISYQASDWVYGISIPTTNSVLYTAKSASQKDDTTIVQDQTTSFMKNNGLVLANNLATTTIVEPQYTTYIGTKAICQLSNSQPTMNSKVATFHELACVNKDSADKEHTDIETLLATYRTTGKLIGFTHAMRFTKTDGNKSYTLLTLTADRRVHALLFTAIDTDTWSFVSDLAAGEVKYSNGKYTITPETLLAISNAKYGDFLTKDFTK
jgi:hypothetical protein